MCKKVYKLSTKCARINASTAISQAPDGYIVEIREPNRTLEQNALLWPLLHCVAKQLLWHGERLSPSEWKDLFTASLKKQKVLPGIDGEMVVCGTSTRTMTKSDFSELCELIYSFGANHDVSFFEASM